MTAPIADGVMAATHKLVQQAMTGQWQEVPKTIQERRELLDASFLDRVARRISSGSARCSQAMTESDAAVAQMAAICRRRSASLWVRLQPDSPSTATDAVATIDGHARQREADDVRRTRHSRSVRRACLRGRTAGGMEEAARAVRSGPRSAASPTATCACCRRLSALDEHGQIEKPDENSPHAADIMRLEMKMNLLLDMVGALLVASRPRPRPAAIRFNALGGVWQGHPAVPAARAIRACSESICATASPSRCGSPAASLRSVLTAR